MEPTQQARPYFNPYETTMQSDPYGIPIIPPPPPREKHHKIWIVWMVGIVVILLAISGTLLLGLRYYGQVEQKPTPTVAPTTIVEKTVIIETPTPVPPTPMPTVIVETPVPTISYYANDIYNDFVNNGLGGNDPRYDTNWSCCTWVPTGRAIVWTDNSSGFKIDLAVFLNVQHAETDASQLEAQGYYASVVHGCMLSYETAMPNNIIVAYLNLMQEYCN